MFLVRNWQREVENSLKNREESSLNRINSSSSLTRCVSSIKRFEMKRIVYLTLLSAVVLAVGCKKEESETKPSISSNLNEIEVPASFSFRTDRPVELKLADDPSLTKVNYRMYAVYENEQEHFLGTGSPVNGVFEMNLVIPDFCKKIKVVRNEDGNITSKFLDATGNRVLGSMKRSSNSTQSCNELLYAVNGQGGFYTLNVEDGSYAATNLPNLVGGGSIACAVNKDSGIVYYNTGNTLRYYDYVNGTFHIAQQGNPFNGNYPRMEYNSTDGMLYIAKNEDMFVINPLTNAVVGSYDIVGLESPVSGGDVAISDDGTIYMCCFSGLYRIDINGNTANATRISAENLPFQPTSMAIDRNDRLYLATNDQNSQLIEMDKFDGAWTVVQTYNHKINDLGSYKCDVAQLANVDTDNDGVIDQLDDFPNDATAAHAVYTPSDIGWGSLAFEDLWPSRGDYDFNDLVMAYRFTQVANSNNEVVRLIAKFQVKAIGAGFHNGFGFKMDVDPSLVASVVGTNITDNLVTLAGNGLEAGHTNGSVVIVFDDAFDNLGGNPGGSFINTVIGGNQVEAPEMEIVVEFTNPIDPMLMGSAPFNPFIFINGTRGRELHLTDYAPTELADLTYFNTVHDFSNPSQGDYYHTENNMPWAINIIHEFRHPLEKTPINQAYNYFTNWAVSAGTSYTNWYKDNSGYRNTNQLYFQ